MEDEEYLYPEAFMEEGGGGEEAGNGYDYYGDFDALEPPPPPKKKPRKKYTKKSKKSKKELEEEADYDPEKGKDVLHTFIAFFYIPTYTLFYMSSCIMRMIKVIFEIPCT